jgi:outer membrane receptor for ferrienterochelin and colicin
MNLGFQASEHWSIRALGNYVDARTEVPNNPLTGTRAYMFGGAPNELFFNSTTSRYRIQGVELTGNLTPAESLKIFGGATWLRAKGTGDDGVERNTMPYTPNFTFQAGFNWDFLKHLHLGGDYQHFQDMYAGTAARTSPTNSPASNFPVLTSLNLLPDANPTSEFGGAVLVIFGGLVTASP